MSGLAAEATTVAAPVLSHRPWWRGKPAQVALVVAGMWLAYRGLRLEYPWPSRLAWTGLQFDLDRFQIWLIEQRSAADKNVVFAVFDGFRALVDDLVRWLEELLLAICVDHSLPFPAVNVPLLGYEVDFLWESARFVVEADGGDHMDRDQRDRDNRRDFTLQRAGFLVRRYSSRDMGRDEHVAREVLGILRERDRLR